MSSWAYGPSTDLWWSTTRSKVLLVCVHIPFLIVAPLATAIGLNSHPQSAWLVGVLATAIAALQLRHSFAGARGERPRWWPVTLTGLGLLVFVPLPWFSYGWGSIQWFFIASAAMLLTGWPRLLFTIAPLLGTPLWLTLKSFSAYTVPTDGFLFVFWIVGLAGGAVCIYGSTQLVRAVDELFTTRAELAESTVGQERRRLSRDLHDLLGQSLSAVSLKGDLALSLLREGSRSAAEEEIHSLTHVAREALQEIRHVVRDEHPISLETETRGAGVLLAAASIAANIDVEVGNLARPVDELLGWATREGVTNMLRHSQASSCTIRAARQDRSVTLEIINDGATTRSSAGSGISGLRERAHAVAGSVTAAHLENGRFRLLVQVPDVEAIA